MSQQHSITVKKKYTIAQVCRIWDVPRSSVYLARAQAQAGASSARRRGPAPLHNDDELKTAIRDVIGTSMFHNEGYRKIWVRLRARGLRASKHRVLRLMRGEGLLAVYRPSRVHGNKAHDGRITTDSPDEMWGTDATSTMTREGNATIFIAVDHCTGECIGIHATLYGNRFEALEPLRQGIRENFGDCEKGVAAGLTIRHDHGSQYTSRDFQEELKFWGMRSSPSFVGEPECNGVVERFNRTIKEQLLWLRDFETVEDLRQALLLFKEQYNHNWLVQKHGHLTPHQARLKLTQRAAQAA